MSPGDFVAGGRGGADCRRTDREARPALARPQPRPALGRRSRRASLLAFLLAWHLLTKYRVNIYVRFLNVPAPEQVLERAMRAFGDPKFFSACRAELPPYSDRLPDRNPRRCPARSGDGPFPRYSRACLSGVRGLSADPSDRLGADVDHAVALERGEHRLHHLPRLVLPHPHQHPPRDEDGRSGAGARGAVPGRKRGRDLPRGLFPCRPTAHLHRPDRRHGRRLGVADRGRDDLRAVRDRLLHLGGLFARAILRHRARNDLHRRSRAGFERAIRGLGHVVMPWARP